VYLVIIIIFFSKPISKNQQPEDIAVYYRYDYHYHTEQKMTIFTS